MKALVVFLLSVTALPVFSGSVCEDWFERQGLDRHSRDCFQKCFTARAGISEMACCRECDDLCQPALKIWLFFANGMFNSQREAKASLDALNVRLYPFLKTKYPKLRFLVPPQYSDVAYNTNEIWVEQLLQVLDQWGSNGYENFFSWLSDMKAAPDWFRKKMAEAGGSVYADRLFRDADLKKQIESYKSHLDQGDAVLVVAHSQGNFYRDEAFTLLDRQRGSPALESFGSVSVATPSQNASPGVIPMGSRWYTTLVSDPVIAVVPHALPPNTKNDPIGLFDHLFISNYLEGNQSGPKILEDTACVLSELNGVLISPSLQIYEDGCHPDDENEVTDEE